MVRKVIFKLLRVIVLLLSFGALIDYYLVTSNVPPIVEPNDLYVFVAVYLIVILVTIIDFTICIRHGYRGGYFTLCFESTILLLWIFSYNGVNFHIGSKDVIYVIKNILFGGIISSAIHVLSQLICLINFITIKDK